MINREAVERIFEAYNLGDVHSLDAIEIGFTNKVYNVNDTFILKVCEDNTNEKRFSRESFFYNYFSNTLPVPRIEVFDDTKRYYDKLFMVYQKINGNTVYETWHLLDNEQRKDIIKQLCDMLKIINDTPHAEYAQLFDSGVFEQSWHDWMVKQIHASLSTIKKEALLPEDFVRTIERFVDENHHALDEQKCKLVYWDAHFDNILVNGTRIVGILDFERTQRASIDFVLDIFRRMSEYPKKYMAEQFEKYAKREDYVYLMDWIREYYPDLFDFKHLNTRLDLYSIEHDLKDVIGWPHVKEVKEVLAKVVKYGMLNK